jgi:2-keto-4-pentenoate hydratase/2-oxohepta-3-ene-1,7-dioic acid hydratase in catechol pathway
MRKLLIITFFPFLFACDSTEPAVSSDFKLFRYGEPGNEKPAIEYPDGTRLDVSKFCNDFDEVFLSTDGVTRLQAWLTKNSKRCPQVPADERYGSCIARPSKIVAIGLNYIEHVQEGTSQSEVSSTIPDEPIIFFKSTTALCGPFDNAIIPLNSRKMDWEVELAVIIGKKASYVSEADAMNYVAGYSIINDYSEREWQLEKDGNQWDKGKSADTFAPLGPYLILPQNLENPQELDLWLKVNGETRQQANTRDMIFNIPALISYISNHMTLLPGDVISTGTPSGVGNAQKPPVFLKEGDVVELGIEKLGIQKQNVVAYSR